MTIGWLQRLRNEPLGLEMLLGRLAMVATLAIFFVREAPGFRFLDVSTQVVLLVATLVFVTAWSWFWLRLAALDDSVWHAVAFAAVLVSVTVIVWQRPIGLFPFYYVVVIAGAAYSWRVGTVLAGITTIYIAGAWWLFGLASVWTLQGLVVTALLGGAAVLVRRYIGVQLELQQARDEIRRLAAAEARAQIARDLHDQLGQTLTTAVMQGELLTIDLREGSADRADERAQRLVETSRESLMLMRRLVTELKSPGMQAEATLAAELLESLGISCTLELTSSPLSPDVDQVLGWVVREGVTNVMRHSKATACQISLMVDDQQVQLAITDNGKSARATTGGNGLDHLRQRLSAVGGVLAISGTAGYSLSVKVPLRASALAQGTPE